MKDVYVIGAHCTEFKKYKELDVRDISKMTIDGVLEDAKLSKGDIDAAYFANCLWGFMSGQHGIRGQIVMRHCGLDRIPVYNVEAACASAASAFQNAWRDLQTGLFECILTVGVEKMSCDDKMKQFKAFESFVDVARMDDIVKYTGLQMDEVMKKVDIPDGASGQRSMFMDKYALIALNHMAKYGTDPMAFAKIASKSHNNGALNPIAQYKFEMTPEEVMNDRMVSYPMTRSMCSPMGDGASSAILCTKEFLDKQPKEVQERAIKVLAAEQTSGTRLEDGDETTGEKLAKVAYAKAGITPSDLSLVEVHDGSVAGELKQYEELGLCEKGKAGEFALNGESEIGGKTPVNTSGGLISRGHPLGATGLAQIYELVVQLRGEAGGRQVKEAKYGLAQNMGGSVGYLPGDEGATFVVTILGK